MTSSLAEALALGSLCAGAASLALFSSSASHANAASATQLVVDFLIVDDFGSPVDDAFVVLAGEELDGSRPNQASSGFTDSSGALTLTLPEPENSIWVNVVSQGFAARVERYINVDTSNPISLTIALETSSTLTYWGSLGSLAVGTGVHVPGLEWRPRAITDASGHFALAVDRSLPLTLHTESAAFEEVNWVIDPLSLASYAHPNSPPEPLRPLIDVAISVSSAAGTTPLSSAVSLHYLHDSKAVDPYEWREGRPLDADGSFLCRLEVGEVYCLFAHDGVRWGSTHFQVPEAGGAGEPSPTLQLQLAAASSSLTTLDYPDGMELALVSVSAYELGASISGPAFISVPIQGMSSVDIAGLRDARYDVEARASGGASAFALNQRLGVEGGSLAELFDPVSMLGTYQSGNTGTVPPGLVSVTGTIVDLTGDLGAVTLIAEKQVVGGGPMRATGTRVGAGPFEVQSAPGGSMALLAIGESQDGERAYYQVDGPHFIFGGDPVTDVGVIRLASAPIVIAEVHEVTTGSVPQFVGPASGATVEVLHDGQVIAVGTTDSNGRVVITGIPRGECSVRVIKAGFESSEPADVDSNRDDVIGLRLAIRSEQ
jgi:hypothetical protein